MEKNGEEVVTTRIIRDDAQSPVDPAPSSIWVDSKWFQNIAEVLYQAEIGARAENGLK